MASWTAAVQVVVLLSPLQLLGCGEDAKKNAAVSGNNDPSQGAPITCEQEAPRLCKMTEPGNTHKYFPKNLRSLCGGKKSEGGGLVLQFCQEGCPKETSIEKMTICVSKELTKAHVVNWGMPEDDAHPMCEEFVERMCHVNAEGVPNSPEFAPLCENEQHSRSSAASFECGRSHSTKGQQHDHPRCNMIQRCLDTCVNRDGFADCMKDEVLLKMLSEVNANNGPDQQVPVPPEVKSEQELHYLEKLEASVLSEAFGTEFDELPTHNLKILVDALKVKHADDHETMRKYLADLDKRNGEGAFQTKDVSGFLLKYDEERRSALERDLALAEARERQAAKGLGSGEFHNDEIADGSVTRQVTGQIKYNPDNKDEQGKRILDPFLVEKHKLYTEPDPNGGMIELSSAQFGAAVGAVVGAAVEAAQKATLEGHQAHAHEGHAQASHAAPHGLQDARESPVGRTDPTPPTSPLKKPVDRWVVSSRGTGHALSQDPEDRVMS